METKSAVQEKETTNQEKTCTDNPIGWAEIPVIDMERAKTFYGSTFGFQFEMANLGQYQMAMFPMTADGTGASGALMKGDTYKPSYDGAVVYFSVQNIEEVMKKATAAGGIIIQPKKSIGRYGFIAFFEDLEGNRIALHARN